MSNEWLIPREYGIVRTYSEKDAERLIVPAGYIGRNFAGKWYEHPEYGDESGLLLVNGSGVHQTYWHDMPNSDDLAVFGTMFK